MTNFDIEELKVIIKSIVISTQGPIEVRDLLSYFKESEGRPLPFASMGYSNVKDFLHDLKDIVKVLPDGRITATVSSDTKHLVELIEKQRPKRSKRRSRPSWYQSKFVHYSQTQYNRQRSLHSRNQSGALVRARYSDSRTSHQKERQRTAQYQDIKPGSSYRNGYNNLSYRNGYNNPSCSNGYNNLSYRNGYNNPSYSKGYNNPSCSNGYNNPSYSRSNGFYKQINRDKNSCTNKDRQLMVCLSSSSRSSSECFDDDRISEEAKENYESVEPSVGLHEPQVSVTRVDYSASLTPQLKNNLRDIICEHPEGILCSQLSQLVWEKYGAPLNFRRYGFSSMIELVDSIPQIFKIEDCKKNDWVLVDAQGASTSQLKNNGPSISNKVCDRVREVAQTLTCPFTVQNFDRRYENMFRKSLSEEVEGFPNITSILKSMDKNFVRLKEIGGDYYVVPLKQMLTHALEAGSDEEADVIDYPSSMLRFGGEVPPLDPFTDAVTPTMEVKLGEIYGPHKFFMISSYLMNAYSSLHKHIQSFYSENTHLALTGLPVKKGLYCAAPYLDEWHRAVITDTSDQTQVMVFLIDFGTHLKLSKSEVRFLHEDFASIPRLALRASLVDIIPPQNSEKFSREANLLFFKLAAEKDLLAVIKSVDFMQQRKYLVQLSLDREVTVSEKLVAARVAEYRPNFSNNNVTSESNVEPTSSSPSPCSALSRILEKVSLKESSMENKEATTEVVEKPKKSAGSILLSLLSSAKKTA